MFFAYRNWVLRYGTLKTTPAVATGLVAQPWTVRKLIEHTASYAEAAWGRMVQCPAGKLAGIFMRFTIRDVVLVTAIVALVAALLIERRGRHNDQIATVRWASEEEQEWAKEKFKAAKSEFVQLKSHTHGTGPPRVDTCSIIERFAQAAEELPADPETRLKELEAALAYAKEVESTTHDKYNEKVEPLMYLNRTQYTRAEVETRLKRVQRELVLERSRK